MCLDMPAQVISRDGDLATVKADGRLRSASVFLVPDVRVGEWVYVAAGTIIDRMDAASAERSVRALGLEIRLAREATQ